MRGAGLFGGWETSLVVCASLLVAGLLDLSIGLDISLSLAYAMVVLFGGWSRGYRGALITTLAAIAVDSAANYLRAPASLTWEQLLLHDVPMWLQWALLGLTGAFRRKNLVALADGQDRLHDAQDRVETAIAEARRVQMGLMSVERPHFEHVEVAVDFDVALGLGGDFFDLRNRPGGLSVLVADVSGKGPSAALIVAVIRGLLEEMYPIATGPAQLLELLQIKLIPMLPDSMFVTCFALFYDEEKGSCRYASAGHDPPFLRRGLEVLELMPTGLPLGVAPELPIREASRGIVPGDLLLVYTDGLVNAPLGNGERLGDDPVKAALLEFDEKDLNLLTQRLFGLTESLATRRQDDDTATLALRFGSVSNRPAALQPSGEARLDLVVSERLPLIC